MAIVRREVIGDCELWLADNRSVDLPAVDLCLTDAPYWLVWDKGQRDFSLADCEFAWVSQQKAARIFTYPRGKAVKDGKQHPTQKPVALMIWCLKFFPKAETVLDCWAGSGTTLVACAKLGRKGIGIEIDPDYFDIACKRVEDAYRQPDLFVEPPKPAVQGQLL